MKNSAYKAEIRAEKARRKRKRQEETDWQYREKARQTQEV